MVLFFFFVNFASLHNLPLETSYYPSEPWNTPHFLALHCNTKWDLFVKKQTGQCRVKSVKGCPVPLHWKGLCQTKGLKIVEQVITQSLLVTSENNYAEESTTAMKLLFHNEPDNSWEKQRKIELAAYGRRADPGNFRIQSAVRLTLK